MNLADTKKARVLLFIIYLKASANAHHNDKNNSPRSISYSSFFLNSKKEEYTQSASIHCLSFRCDKNFADF